MNVVVDIGSNTLKFIAARVEGGKLVVHSKASWATRLGKGLDRDKILSPSSVGKTKSALEEIQKTVAKMDSVDLRVVATAAVREAKNSDVVAKMVQDILKVPLWILSGDEEAYLSKAGAASSLEQAKPWLDSQGIETAAEQTLFIDVGGASTELNRPQGHRESFKIGAVRLFDYMTQEKNHNGFCGPNEKALADEMIQSVFTDQNLNLFKQSKKPLGLSCAIGGTLMATIGAMPAHHSIEAGIFYSKSSDVFDFEKKISAMTSLEREKQIGIDAGRADIAVSGIMILTFLLKSFQIPHVTLTEWGLRHGVLLSNFRK